MDVRSFVESIGYRILVGLILVSVIILSFAQLLQVFHVYLLSVENGFVLSGALFFLIFILSVFGFYSFFKQERKEAITKFNQQNFSDEEIDIKSLTFSLVEVFLQGVMKKK